MDDDERKRLMLFSAAEAAGDADVYGYLLFKRSDVDRVRMLRSVSEGMCHNSAEDSEEHLDMEWLALLPWIASTLPEELKVAQRMYVHSTCKTMWMLLCPHCHTVVQIPTNMVNCGIFRHAIVRASGVIVSPHASKEKCDKYLASGTVYGCVKPFKFTASSPAEKCDYV
jgi:hypothetical protein